MLCCFRGRGRREMKDEGEGRREMKDEGDREGGEARVGRKEKGKWWGGGGGGG
jgi:hypothetical protein